MRLVTKKDMGLLVGCSRRSIDDDIMRYFAKAVNPGRRPSLYDLDSTPIREALRKRGAEIDEDGSILVPAGFQPERPWGEADEEFVAPDEERSNSGAFALNRADLECSKIEEQVRNLRLQNAKKRKELIERLVVQKLLAALFSIDTIELGTLADTIGDELLAQFDQGVRPQLGDIKDIINSGVTRTTEHINRRMIEFLETELGPDPSSGIMPTLELSSIPARPTPPPPPAPRPRPTPPPPPVDIPESEPPPIVLPGYVPPFKGKAPPEMVDGKLNPEWVKWANNR